MRELNYNLYLELQRKKLLNEEEINIIGNILGNIDIDINPYQKCNSIVYRNDDNSIIITKYANINGLDNGRLEIVNTDKSITVKLSGYVNHYLEEINYTYSKNSYGVFDNKHYESLFYRFETANGEYMLSAFPSKKKNITVDSEFYNRFSKNYIRERKPYSYDYEGILPTSLYKIDVKDVSTLARGAVSGDLRRFLIEKHSSIVPQNVKAYQKRKI